MTQLRKIVWSAVTLLLAAAVLVWFLPARWALPLLVPYLRGGQLQQVSGTLWQGRAEHLLTRSGQVLGRLQWQLSRRALIGQRTAHVVLEGPELAVSGVVQSLPDGDVVLQQVHVRAVLSDMAENPLQRVGQPRGELIVVIEQARLQGGWPLQLQAAADWNDAAVHTRSGEVALGTWQLHATAQRGLVQVNFNSVGDGPLTGQGQWQLSPLGWRLVATLQPQRDNPALHRWLRQFGPVGVDGQIHIQRRAGLAI